MRLTRFERNAQGLTRAEQVLLADDFIEGGGAQAFG
jgi:adenine/guanine phosphoribosyltransferase-like PRPP-binding protein